VRSNFKFCPRCGSPSPGFRGDSELVCAECGFDYFHNVATGAGVFLVTGGKILFIVRGKEPAKGKFGLPGGFVDPGEGAEAAVLRECREELGVVPASLRYLASFPNSYEYRGVRYSTCDLYFVGELADRTEESLVLDREEACAAVLLAADEVEEDDLAFPSLKKAFAALKAGCRD
jgi:NAD+ diphosphatase